MSHFSGDKLVIYIPGMNSVRSDVHRIGLKLYKETLLNNISMISFDYRGLGISDGYFENATFTTKLEDTEKILHYALNNGFKLENIYFLGFSDGAILALYLNNKYNANIIFWSPLIINEVTTKNELTVGRNIFNTLVIEDYGLAFKTEYFHDKSMIIKNLQNFKPSNNNPLIIYGGNDFTVIKSLEFIGKVFIKPEFISIQDGDHIFSSPKREYLTIKNTINWILGDDIYAE